MSLKKKLLLYNLVLSAFLVISGGIGYLGSRTTAEKYDHVVQVNMRFNEALGEMDTAKTRVLIHMYRLAHPTFTAEERSEILAMLGERMDQYAKAEESYRATAPEYNLDDPLFNTVTEKWHVIEGLTQKFADFTQAKTDEGLTQMQILMKETLDKDRLAYDEAIGKLIVHHRAEAAKWIEEARKTNDYASSLGMLALAAALFASIASGLLIGQGMSRQISRLADRLTESSSGVFRESVKVSAASTQLAAAMAEQASAIQETVAAVDEISAMVAKTADNSTNSQSESGRMNDVAMKGKESLDQVVASISEISESNNQVLHQIELGNAQLEKIVVLINQIGEKTKVINDIVFQTKLLSFNASVEAARAGEHGKGFAVVAEEVGNLASMSGNAAKDISAMLDASTSEVKKIVSESKEAITSLMGRARGKFEDSRAVARECARIFDQIITQMEAVNRNVNDIATASREQTTGIREINRVMNGLSEATMQNSTTTGETANSSLELKRQAEDVKLTVGELMTLVTGQLNGETGIRTVSKPVPAATLQKVEKAKISKGKFAGSAALKKLVAKGEAEKAKDDVTMQSRTKPIASSALIQPKPSRTPAANIATVISMSDAKKAEAEKAAKQEKARAETKNEEAPQAKASGDFENFPNSDDDRFEKV